MAILFGWKAVSCDARPPDRAAFINTGIVRALRFFVSLPLCQYKWYINQFLNLFVPSIAAETELFSRWRLPSSLRLSDVSEFIEVRTSFHSHLLPRFVQLSF